LSRLEVAAERLAKALESLEQAALSRPSESKTKSAVAGLMTERERLVARVAELEEEARSLSGLTEEVEGRLDGAIAEIRAALGR
jgi:hypothetical protein